MAENCCADNVHNRPTFLWYEPIQRGRRVLADIAEYAAE